MENTERHTGTHTHTVYIIQWGRELSARSNTWKPSCIKQGNSRTDDLLWSCPGRRRIGNKGFRLLSVFYCLISKTEKLSEKHIDVLWEYWGGILWSVDVSECNQGESTRVHKKTPPALKHSSINLSNWGNMSACVIHILHCIMTHLWSWRWTKSKSFYKSKIAYLYYKRTQFTPVVVRDV